MSDSLIVSLLITELFLIPILGLIWLAIRQEQKNQKKLYQEAVSTLKTLAISRGNKYRR